jgi:hypothetical protein
MIFFARKLNKNTFFFEIGVIRNTRHFPRSGSDSFIENSQPNGSVSRIGFFHPVTASGRNINGIARPQVNSSALLKRKGCRSLEQKNPFALSLVVPESVRRFLPERNNPLNPDAIG